VRGADSVGADSEELVLLRFPLFSEEEVSGFASAAGASSVLRALVGFFASAGAASVAGTAVTRRDFFGVSGFWISSIGNNSFLIRNRFLL
jgi:hypothetical protein